MKYTAVLIRFKYIQLKRRRNMSLHVVMVNPEIPPNTGNVARSCAATGSVLHLVKPLGFDISDKALKRAGLDYWQYVDVRVHESLEDFLEEYSGYRMFLATTKGGQKYTDVSFEDEDMILFGRETAGLPRDFIAQHEDAAIRIPMSEDTRLRSLNLANSVNIILFEALRQMGFPDLL